MPMIEAILSLRKKARTRLFSAFVASCFHTFGKGTRIVPPFRGGALDRISLGEDVYISEGCWVEVIRGHASGGQPVIVFGDHVRIGMDVTITGARSVVIEDYAAIARNVFISDHGHQFQHAELPVILQGVRKVAGVRIGRGAWLGHGVVILPGVTIGRNAVVGANSVVSEDVPDFSVAVGAPARIVRRYNQQNTRWERVEPSWRQSSGA